MRPVVDPTWEITWTPKQTQSMYRDWALYLDFKRQFDKAAFYYDKSLQLRPDDVRALYQRSICKRLLARAESALLDSRTAALYDPDSSILDLEICDGIFEFNEFEECAIELSNAALKYKGHKAAPFYYRLDGLSEHFNDSLGANLGPFLLSNERIFTKVRAYIESKQNVEKRPMWKILRDEDRCDVQSDMEVEEELISPREVARREQCNKITNQIYLGRAWKDVNFLKILRDNRNFLLTQFLESHPVLKTTIDEKYKVVKRYLKMLRARSPWYNEQRVRTPIKKVMEKYREAYLYRVQYQTHRNMLTILRNVRSLRSAGKIAKLTTYVEQSMGDYVVLKTHRVMPWKFEFIHEVYSTLALAYTDRCTIPKGIQQRTDSGRIFQILRLPQKKDKEYSSFIFGDMSTYREALQIDPEVLQYKGMLARLEKRMVFAKYCIECCYLLHEIARQHFKQGRFEECCASARKAIEEARNCHSHIWEFLSAMMIVRASTMLGKVERCAEALVVAREIVLRLADIGLLEFVDTCIDLNHDVLTYRTLARSSAESVRKSKSKHSHGTVRTSVSSRSSDYEDTKGLVLKYANTAVHRKAKH